MNILESGVYSGDLKLALSRLDTEKLKNKCILVTGACGLICSAVVDLLIAANREHRLGMKIYAAGRSVEKLGLRFPDAEQDGLIPVAYDALKCIAFDFSVDYIIHGAGNASPDKYMKQPVDTMMANILGIRNLMEYAAKTNVEKVLYISSSEVYGKLSTGEPLKEDVYGSTDILSVRSSYPMGKQAAETLCVAYAEQYGINVSIVRPGHIYGPTAQPSDNRVSSLFARQAAAGNDIVMKSMGTQIRSYCYCVDCASAIITVLLCGENREAYNISNSRSIITIYQMASLIAESAGVTLKMELPSQTEKAAFNPMDNSSLDSKKLENLGWNGCFDAKTGFLHTIKVLRDCAPE